MELARPEFLDSCTYHDKIVTMHSLRKQWARCALTKTLMGLLEKVGQQEVLSSCHENFLGYYLISSEGANFSSHWREEIREE